MRRVLACGLFFVVCGSVVFSAESQHSVTERGAHHRIWSKSVPVTDPSGRVVNRTSQYTEIGTGLNYWDGREWAESKEEISLVEGGAIAEHGQHKVSFAANINSAPALILNTPDNKTFRTRILGIAYFDPVTGQSELIGELRDSIGELVGKNQIIYRDCFLGVKADVRLTYTKAGFEQDIIFRERLNSPEFYQLSEHSRVQVWTELFDPPTPLKQTQVLRSEEDVAVRGQMADPDFKDDSLDFGYMRMTRGKAFSIENDLGGENEESIDIGKEWTRIEARDFLIESAEYRTLRPLLEVLPAAVTAKRLRPEAKKHLSRSELVGMLSRIKPRQRDRGLQMARVEARHDKGVVLDYLLTSSQTNFTFRGDITYYVSSGVILSGTTTIEGGTVIKSTNVIQATVRLSIQGPVNCATDAYRPAIFTGMDDDSVGEVISGSTGNPTTSAYGSYIHLSGNTNAVDLHDLQMRYPYYAFYLNTYSGLTIRNTQIKGCNTAFAIGTFRARNVLIQDSLRAVGGSGVFHGEHITLHRLDALRSITFTDNNLTNCLIISVTNNVVYSGVNVVTNRDDSGIFQTVGGGSHYLADSSPYRNAGTTNINPDLFADLKKRTTYPPVLLVSNTISINTTLGPQAQRDTDVPDLGFHYAPIDYLAHNCNVTNATLILTNGASVGTVGSPGFWLWGGSQMVSEGSPINRNHIARYNTAQENPLSWGPSTPALAVSIYPNADAGPLPTGNFRFTDFEAMSASGYHFETDETPRFGTLGISDCEFNSSFNTLAGAEDTTIGLTNNLFLNVSNVFRYFPNFFAYNNLFKGGICGLDHYGAGAGYVNQWEFHDNAFDGVVLFDAGDPVTHSHNAYIGGTTHLQPGTNSTDKVLTSLTYEVGPLGRFYQPTNSALTNLGSRLASAATLYHYTLHTNQVKEATSQVDIGYHYVALDAQNQPVDTEGDGIPDYFEDKNGNGGSADTGETDWQSYNSQYGGSSPLKLEVFTPLK